MSEFTPKRVRKPGEWKDKVAKDRRASGKEYTNRKGNTNAERKIGHKCRCTRRCLESFTQNISKRILNNFNELGDQNSQDSYLQNLIKVKPIRNSKSATRPNLQNYQYEVHIGEVIKRVCREGLASIRGIGVKRIRRLANLKSKGMIPKDDRGRHNNRPRKKPEDLVNSVKAHIESFQYKLSHYSKTGQKKRYLPSTLNVLKMYHLYIQKYYPEAYTEMEQGKELKRINCELKYDMYLKIYKENYNYPFGRPRTDVCSTCEELKTRIENDTISNTEKTQLKAQLKCHEMKSKLFYANMKQAIEDSKENDSTDMLCFDFKQNIPCPHLSIGEVFYSRQLWLHVMSFYSGKTGKSIMYCWPESEAKKGANEVASVINHYIKNFLNPSVINLMVLTDGARGQNVNHIMIRFWSSLVINNRFVLISYFIPERGHSFLPCDRHFAIIEKLQRRREKVESPEDWIQIIAEKFRTIEVNGSMIQDFNSALVPFFRNLNQLRAVGSTREKYTITKYKKLVFEPNVLNVYATISGWHHQQFIIKNANVDQVPFPTQGMYRRPLPIKKGKLDDVIKLLPFVNGTRARRFYKSLKPSDAAEESEDFED